MTIPISLPIKDYFKTYLSLLNPILNLKPQEINILSKFMLLQYGNRQLNQEDLNKLLFSSATRKLIRQSLKLPVGSFNNSFHVLAKKNLITSNGLSPRLKFTQQLTFNFTINDQE